jgi:uroporphyrinogen-III synthase
MKIATTMNKKKVESILISQPKPEVRSPYFTLSEKYNVKVEFNQFISVEGLSVKEFRKQRININDFPAVIFTSRNAMDHYFRLCEEMRTTVSQETKYFCISEAIALYLQKHIQYRKRKVFFGNGSTQDFKNLLLKHKSTGKFLYPCTEIGNSVIPDFLNENGFDYKEASLYRTVSSDLSNFNIFDFDMFVFFSPLGVKSLLDNHPDFKQGDIKIAAFGPATCEAVKAHGLRLDIEAPTPEAPSMSQAIEQYLESQK